MRTLFALLLCSGLAVAADAPAVRLPAEVKGQPGDFVTVPSEPDGPEVRWFAADPGLKVFPSQLLRDSRTAVVTAMKPGRYRLLAWTAKGDVPSVAAVCVVVIGDPPPTPPGPNPPPGPGPTPPNPNDPLAKDLQALYAAEPAPDKAKHLASLAALYKQAGAIAGRPDVATCGDLIGIIRAASATLLPADALTTLRDRIAAELVKELPTDPKTPLDAPLRAKAAALFTRIALALETVK